MHFTVFVAVVVAIFTATSVSAESAILRSNGAPAFGRRLRLLGAVEEERNAAVASGKWIEGVKENVALRKIAKEIINVKKASQLTKDEYAKLRLMAEVAKQKKVGGDAAKLTKMLSKGGKTDDEVAKLVKGVSEAAGKGEISKDMMAQLSKVLAEEMKKAEPKKMSALKKAVVAALGITVGAAVIYIAYGMMNPTRA
ncbi:hypothetical protein ON010_g116 [Phytophthora cinnamomi]|nr:hypothetical protein ON010_g116 [Phytophthora cinnamomi]